MTNTEYKNIENIKQVLDLINSNYDKFDWNGADWDWCQNCKAFKGICETMWYPFYIEWKQDDERGNRFQLTTTHRFRLDYNYYHYTVVMWDDFECRCDFESPIDILRLIDDIFYEVNKLNDYIKKANE